ncbi:MAG: hypothetical protein JWP85_2009 [Rhodoglobus sp.]|nr:hypothetical protein [Rhodoglobus sp.]
MTKHASVRAGRILDAQLHLLDRQVLDADRVPIAAVDDIELTDIASGDIAVGTEGPIIENLLSGPVLATRIFGGRPPASRWHRVPWGLITELGTAIRISAPGSDLDVTWVERWMRDHVIGRIPGGRHAPE